MIQEGSVQVGMPLLWVSLAFLAGLGFQTLTDLDWLLWIFPTAFCLILVILDPLLRRKIRFFERIRNKIPLPAGLILLFFALGGLRLSTNHLSTWQPDHLAWYNDKGRYVMTVWISAAPDRREDMTLYQVSVLEIMNTDRLSSSTKISGIAQVRMSADAAWQYGDLLQFTAWPLTPFESRDFSYRDYLAVYNIHTMVYYPQHVIQLGVNYGSRMRAWLIRFREKAWETIFEIYPQPESGLLAGILLGIDSDLPSSLAQAYRDTGVAHIIAISGFNMAVLAGFFLWFFARLVGPYWAALISAILLGIYTIFVDGAPSVVRALIMAIMAAGGHLIGRRQVGINALCFTAAVMCLFNPLLLGNVSFQLSFTATLGLVLFAEPMQDWLKARLEKSFSEKLAAKLTGPMSEYFLFTLAAQFATLPVITAQFGRISLSSLLANPLVLPFQPAVLILGGVTTLAGMIHPILGKVCMLFSWPFLKYTNFMVVLLAKIKGGVLTIHPAFTIWILIVSLFFLLTFLLRHRLTQFFHSSRFVWIVLTLLFSCFAVWSIYLHSPDGNLHLHLVRCGESATIYLQTPGGKTVLIDPKGNVNELTSQLESTLSPWDFHLDTVLLTDPKSDADLTKLSERIKMGQILLSPSVYQLENEEEPVTIPDGIAIEKLVSRQHLEVEPGLILTLLSENGQDTALLLEFGGQRILIPDGVDYALIHSETPDVLVGLTALVLTPEDVRYIPPRVWTNLAPRVILWNGVSLSPFTGSFGTDVDAAVSLVLDGTNAWIER